MSDGIGCTCFASYQGECACNADWTPQEVYELRDKVAYYSKLALENSLRYSEQILKVNTVTDQRDELLVALKLIIENDGAYGSKCYNAQNICKGRDLAYTAIAKVENEK